MKKFFCKVRGEFEKTMVVYADDEEGARLVCEENGGDDIDETAVSIPMVLLVDEVE